MPKIATRRRKGIKTNKRQPVQGEENYGKNRKSDINKENRQGQEYHEKVKRQGEVRRRSRKGEPRESGQGEDDQYKEKTVTKRIGEVILTRQRYNYNKDKRSDID